MPTESKTTAFPAAEVEARLRTAIERLGRDIVGIREPWEPVFDSLAVVDVVLVVEELLPGLKISPDKVVRRGGYGSADEAAKDITGRLRAMWERHH